MYPFLLISEVVLLPTVRAVPGDVVTGHTPEVFLHAVLTHGKTTFAGPGKTNLFATGNALVLLLLFILPSHSIIIRLLGG